MTGAIAEVRRSLSASDDATLIEGFAERVRRDRMATAELVAHVEEIDRRELWARHGCSSMFSFCTDRFHISESQAGRLIWAARTARRFPVIFDMLAGGDVHLTTINTLAAYLTDENHRDVLSRARHLKKRELERLVAEIAPRPDVPSRVVALPRPRDAGTAPASLLALDAVVEKAMETPPPSSASPARPAGRVEPLSPRRFKIEVTVDEDTHDALRELQDLLSHQIPNGDPAAIVARALNELLERTRAKRAAKTDRPKARKNDVATPARTRHVPAAARRKTWEDSGGRCAYVSPDGHRCAERRFLEIHHLEPFARGGTHDSSNTVLFCRAHNQYQANRDYGRAFMDAKRRPPDGVRESLSEYARRATAHRRRERSDRALNEPCAFAGECS